MLIVHSGLHAGGLPMNSGKHEQTDCPLMGLHWLLGPQGEGLQGLLIVWSTSINERSIVVFFKSNSVWCGFYIGNRFVGSIIPGFGRTYLAELVYREQKRYQCVWGNTHIQVNV